MHHPADWAVPVESVAQHADGVGLGLAAVDNDSEVASVCEVEMAGEVIFLVWKRRIVPVAIQAGLTHRHDAR
jgi:hypothetical protein